MIHTIHCICYESMQLESNLSPLCIAFCDAAPNKLFPVKVLFHEILKCLDYSKPLLLWVIYKSTLQICWFILLQHCHDTLQLLISITLIHSDDQVLQEAYLVFPLLMFHAMVCRNSLRCFKIIYISTSPSCLKKILKHFLYSSVIEQFSAEQILYVITTK